MESILEASPFFELVQARKSVRRFRDQPVEHAKIARCLEAARLAPSAENVQPWRFCIIDDPATKTRLAQQAFTGIYRTTRWAERAPVLVVIFAEPDILANRIGKQMTGINYYLIDIGIAGEHFALQAQELGLGTCWIGWFSAKGAQKALHVPRSYRAVEMMALGYPHENYKHERKRKSINDISFYNEYHT